ncbi:MAG TPA: MinD/ParA family protein [Gammaproteobacteria bacterium]
MNQNKTEVIAVSSGKGGVGKTTLTVNMGIAMARQGKRVCLFDADTNLANINILLRETPLYTLQHVLDGEKAIADIVVRSHGISLVPGASGITDFNSLDQRAQLRLLRALSELEHQYDVILVDTSAGIHDNVLDFIQAAQQMIVVVTPEPTSLTDSFSLLRMLRKQQYRKRINVVVNQADSELGARQVFKRFSGAVAKYIGYHPAYLGYVSRDPLVSSAVCSQVPVQVYRPQTQASMCFNRLGHSLASLIKQQQNDLALSDSWRAQITPLEQTGEPLLDSDNPLGLQPSVPLPAQLPETSPEAPSATPLAVTDVTPEPSPQSQQPVQYPRSTDSEPISDQTRQLKRKYQQAARTRKKQVLQDHKQSMIDYIEDGDFSKQEIALTLDRFLSVFFRRFKDYPADIVEQFNLLLQVGALPQSKINQLFNELMLFYKDNRIRVDRDTSTALLNQQINDYVDEYGQYPFDTSQALMQSIGMGQVSNEAIEELYNILNMVGGSTSAKTVPGKEAPINEKTETPVYVTDIEEDRNELAESLKENMSSPTISVSDQYGTQGLRDSISFASRLSE